MDTGNPPTLFKLPPRTGKTQNVALNENLHRLVKLKAALLTLEKGENIGIRDLVEPAVEAMIEPDRERLEAILKSQTEGGK